MTDKSAELSAPSNAECLVPGSPRRLTYSGLGSAAAIQTGGASATPKAVHLIQLDGRTKIKKHDSMILWKRGVIQCCAGGNGTRFTAQPTPATRSGSKNIGRCSGYTQKCYRFLDECQLIATSASY